MLVRPAPDLDARLPRERAARVTVRTATGERTVEVPNPVGDVDHHPLDEAAVLTLLTGWLQDEATVRSLGHAVAALPTTDDVGPLLRGLA